MRIKDFLQSGAALLSGHSKPGSKLCMLCKYVFGRTECAKEAGEMLKSHQPYCKKPFPRC